MRATLSIAGLIAACLWTLVAAGSHHATALQYDISKTVTLEGTVSKLEWANPHVHIQVDVKGARGIETWDIELASPGGTIVSGLSKDVLKPGTAVTLTGYPGKASASSSLCATHLKLADGTTATFVVGL